MTDNIHLVHAVSITPQELHEFTLEFLSYLKDTGATYQTLRRYLSTFENFIAWLSGENFTREAYVRWINQCEDTYKPSTVQSRHSQMNSFFTFLVAEGLLKVNPIIGLGTPRSERGLSDNFKTIRSELPLAYYRAAKEAYELEPSEDFLIRWVCVELLYTFGCSPDLMPRLNINLENSTYGIEGLHKCVDLMVDGPVDACRVMASKVYRHPMEFKGTLVSTRDMSNLVTKALNKNAG